jgi:4-alpha-glucanotransferase
MAPSPAAEIQEALRRLGIRRLVLSIQDPSFPSRAEEETGRGTPYSVGGLEFLRFVRGLGFDAVQLGPQGQTSKVNPSPYDGTLFSRNITSIGLHRLAFEPRYRGLLSRETFERLVESTPQEGLGARYRHAFDSAHAALGEAYRTFRVGVANGASELRTLAAELDAFREGNNEWLLRDALHAALKARHGKNHRAWPEEDGELYADPGDPSRAARRAELFERERDEIDRYAFAQLVAHQQHESLRRAVTPWGLELYGDLQVGFSPGDVWGSKCLFLPTYLMGAPPSRTNPAGQPWGYAVLDPAQMEPRGDEPGHALVFLRQRLDKMLAEYDGLRIDHPHGFVCPWVYRADDPDPFHAVQNGARLRGAPNLPDHPELAAYAIARPDQLRPSAKRYSDDWVRALDEDQVARFSVAFDAMAEALASQSGAADRLVCEVLSTQPYPLERVMARHGLGRFRVTQKANLEDPDDVYRAENAKPEDWIMVGNHDTPPIWRLAREWHGTEEGARQAAHLARVLRPTGDRDALERALREDPRALVHAKVAELFVSPAAHVLVFFADLLGLEDVYNRPGHVDETNWSLRVPEDFERRYRLAAPRGTVLDLPCVLALALRAGGDAAEQMHRALLARLDALASYRIN